MAYTGEGNGGINVWRKGDDEGGDEKGRGEN